MKKQTGFTLIELVVVIVVLGILAVTAAPRFLNIQDDAREARLEGMKGAIASGLGIGYGKMATAGLEHLPYVSNYNSYKVSDSYTIPKQDLPFDGCNVGGSNNCVFLYGYPDADNDSLPLLIQSLESSNSDWEILRHPKDDNRREIVIIAKDDPKGSLTECGVLYGPPRSKSDNYKLEVLPCP